ncbi:hypothetical protein QJQ45_028669, partial [Haematococcus lacustris]
SYRHLRSVSEEIDTVVKHAHCVRLRLRGAMVKGRKRIDLDVKLLPPHCFLLIALGAVLGVLSCVIKHASLLGWSVELPQDLALLLEPAAVLAIAFVSFTQGWRDELEGADAARLAGLQVFVVAAHTCRCLGLTGAGAALGLLVQALLAARNSLGLRVAWLQGRLPRARLQEQALALACVTASAALLLARPLVAAQHGAPDLTLLITPSSCCQQGRATAGLLLAEALGAALGCLLALAACHSERWPAGNMRDMASACLLLAGGGLAHATSLALKPGSQVQALSACCCLALLLAGQALAATSAYRRTPLPSKGLM